MDQADGVVHSASEVVEYLRELLLVRGADVGRNEAPPFRHDAVERVRDVLALHRWQC